MGYYYTSWYTWWWVWVVFFVVILGISLCSYCCRRHYVNRQAVVVRAPEPVQCSVTTSMPMYPSPGHPGGPPAPYAEGYQYPPQMPGYSAPPPTGVMSPPYGMPTSPPYTAPVGQPQYNIPGYSNVPPPYESAVKQY